MRGWGHNGYGQLELAPNLGPPRLSNIVSIAAGGAHNLALRADGTVVAWDYNNHGQTNVPPGLSNVVAIAAGGDHSLALKSDGTVVAWGDNSYGESTVPPGLGRVIAISAGFHDSMALVLPSSPTLQAQLAGGELVLSWPTNYPDFTLQCSPDLRTVDWTDCRSPPVVLRGAILGDKSDSRERGVFPVAGCRNH